MPKAQRYGPWGPVVEKGLLGKKGGSISTVQMGGKEYYVYAEPLDSSWTTKSWSVVSVGEKDSSYEATSGQTNELLIRPLLFLFVVSIVNKINAGLLIPLVITRIKEPSCQR